MKGAKRLHLPLCGLGMLSPPSPAPILPIPVVFLSRALSQAQSIPSSIFFLACFDWCISCCSSALPAVDVGGESWKAEDGSPTFVPEQTPSVPSTRCSVALTQHWWVPVCTLGHCHPYCHGF